MTNSRIVSKEAELPIWLQEDMRSNHAGETGAVYIYRGILSVSKNEEIRSFAREHLKTEEEHLDLISKQLSQNHRSLFLPIWKVAGFLTGAIPSIFGRNAVYATIDAVETFVGEHYLEQIHRLQSKAVFPELRVLLEKCRADELEHRDEARDAKSTHSSSVLGVWCWLVREGSRLAVALARWR